MCSPGTRLILLQFNIRFAKYGFSPLYATSFYAMQNALQAKKSNYGCELTASMLGHFCGYRIFNLCSPNRFYSCEAVS